MSGFRSNVYKLAVLVLLAAFTGGISAADVQMTRRSRRESNANRQARITRNIQETYTHRYELFGGGGFLRFRAGENLQRNAEVTWATSATYYLNPKLGIVADIRGAYGNAKVGNTIYNIPNPQISEYPFMAGPTYRVRMKQKYDVSVFALGGTAIGKFDGGSKGISAANLGIWPSTNARPAFSVGANLDYNVYPNLAFRIAPSYLGTTFGGGLQNNMGFEMGIVYRFGRQK